MTTQASSALLIPTHALAAWRELADALSRTRTSCQSGNVDDWFDADTAFAIAACASCPARVPCATYALRAGEPYGVWGGVNFTPRTRRRKSAAA